MSTLNTCGQCVHFSASYHRQAEQDGYCDYPIKLGGRVDKPRFVTSAICKDFILRQADRAVVTDLFTCELVRYDEVRICRKSSKILR